MQAAVGKSISNQLVTGRLYFYHRLTLQPSAHSLLTWKEELQRFHTAQRQAVLELAALYDRAFDQVGVSTASIFAIHAMLLEDEDFVNAVVVCLQKTGSTAEYAVQCACQNFAGSFSAMSDPYMRARAVDIWDISLRMMRSLMDCKPQNPLESGPAILVCNEFLPSEVMEMDHCRLLGLISQHGSVTSHAAMLLRAYSIPAIAEIHVDDQWDGHLALLDGFGGRLYCDPDAALLSHMNRTFPDGSMLEQMELQYKYG